MTGLTAEQALIRASDIGIHQLPVPTPFAVGRVNAYLIEDDPLTLVDTGPNSDRSLAELERHLLERGRRVEEIGMILITHNHMDHIGLVEAVAGRSRAVVAALAAGADRMADFDRDTQLQDRHAVELMLRHGVPESTVETLREVAESFHPYGAPAHVSRPLADGEVVELAGRRLRALHRPGHSPLDTLFWDEDRGYAFCGDHLLAHISSNPLLTRPLRDGDERPKALADYLESMRETAKMDLEYLLPGHGEVIADHRSLVSTRIAGHERRMRKIFDLIAEGPKTAYEVALSLWGNVAVTQAYLCLSEVIGHTDLLVADGRISEVDDGDLVRFSLAPGEQA